MPVREDWQRCCKRSGFVKHATAAAPLRRTLAVSYSILASVYSSQCKHVYRESGYVNFSAAVYLIASVGTERNLHGMPPRAQAVRSRPRPRQSIKR